MSIELTQDDGGNLTVELVAERFFVASLDSASRASKNIESALGVLSTHIDSPNKTTAWRDQTSWLLTVLKDESLDGLDVLEQPHENERHDILVFSNLARKALFSASSPLQGAVALCNGPLHAFAMRCVRVREIIDQAIYQHSESHQQVQRSRPRQSPQTGPNDPNAIVS